VEQLKIQERGDGQTVINKDHHTILGSRTYFDTESVGLTGPLVLIQTRYAGENYVYHIWDHSVEETLKLLEWLCSRNLVVYNMTHDWFHVNKLYNLFYNVPKNRWKNPPIPEEIAAIERALVLDNRHAEWCLKPKGVLDLFLYLRSGPLQELMIPKTQDSIKIPLVPNERVKDLAELLRPIADAIPDIYFHYRQDKGRWHIDPDTGKKGFSHLIFRMAPSMGLKPVIKHLFNREVQDYPVAKEWWLNEDEWKPWGNGWEHLIRRHILTWKHTSSSYATDDVEYLELLDEHYNYPPLNDLNSKLSISVACARWKGFDLDLNKIKHELNNQRMIARLAPQAPAESRRYISNNDPLELIKLPNTKKETLEEYIKLEGKHSDRARQVLNARRAQKRIEILEKLIKATRFFPSYKVIGTKSNRMAGAGSLNPQGIPHEKEFRKLFTLCSEQLGDCLSGGDYAGFEVTIADAVYNDNKLHVDLTSGKKIHGLLGAELYGTTYEKVLASEGGINYPAGDNIYNPAKNAVFAFFYGAMAFKIGQTASIDEKQAAKALKSFEKKYPGIGKERKRIQEMFCSVTQPGGKGTPVIWKDPAEKIESLLGFPRYYKLENSIIKGLYDVGERIPIEWSHGNNTVCRNDREQTVGGACRSAIYSTVFRLQQRNLRTAANHVIQSTGAEICKELQSSLWNLQPVGVQKWYVQLMNNHDEILCCHPSGLKEEINDVVAEHIKVFKKYIPLLEIDWKDGLKDWSDK
jgi:hypothetical protein